MYENIKRVVYEGGMWFLPVCPKCGRFVKADKTLKVLHNERTGSNKMEEPNATCKKCGRIFMFFEGYF